MDDKQRLLSALVGDLFRRHDATMADGVAVLSSLLIYSAVAGKIERDDLVKVVNLAWDELQPVYAEMVEDFEEHGPPRGEDYHVEISPEVQAQMDENPEMKAAITEMIANMRQAFDRVATGEFDNVDEAMEATGAERVELEDLPTEVRRKFEAHRRRKLDG
ncbi:hypothetical protein [Bradyrhizobium ottawaense]|uniref:hypothetical protein n=1 Tax=Bradyrhizobium ottawaense TaxID=931866 RepID=UPI0030F48685